MRSQTQLDLDRMVKESLKHALVQERPRSVRREWVETNTNYRCIDDTDCLGDAVWYVYEVMLDIEIEDMSMPAKIIAQVIDDWKEV